MPNTYVNSVDKVMGENFTLLIKRCLKRILENLIGLKIWLY